MMDDDSTSQRRYQPQDIARWFASPVVGGLSLLVLIQLILVAALLVFVDRTAWHVDLPRSIRTGIVAYEFVVAAPWFVGFALLGWMAGRLSGWRKAIASIVVAVLALLWFTSWAVFWNTGRFLDKEALGLTMASPVSMLLHTVQFAPLALVLLPFCAAGFAVAFVALGRVGARTPPAARLTFLALVLVPMWYAFSTAREAAELLANNETRITHPRGGTIALGVLYRSLRDDYTGPIAYLQASLGRPGVTSQQAADVEVQWPERTKYVAQPPAQPFNVIVLVIESLRSDELAAWGSRLSVMPHTDALARESVVFLDHIAVATHSSYSTVVPVSGQFPLRDPNLHVYPARPGYPRVHLYDVLKPLGYRTAIISSQDESWGGMANFLASDNLDHFLHAETFTGPHYVAEEDAGFARYARQFGRAGKIDDRFTIDEAIRWIGDERQPFFAYINLQNSHVPYPIPADAPTPFAARKREFAIRFNLFPADSVAKVRGTYRNALHYVDAQIGRLTEHLRATGQLDRTILMIMGDHGQGFLEHGFGAHGNELYEELLRTPLLVRAPGLKSELRRGLAQHVDVAPTVLGLLGLPAHPAFQGIDLFAARRAFAYAIVQTPLANQYGVTDGRWKLVVDGHRGNAVLRDLQRDPREHIDFAPQDTAIAHSFRRRADTWRDAQLRYYRTPAMQATMYAPILPAPPRAAVVEAGPATSGVAVGVTAGDAERVRAGKPPRIQ